MLGKPFEVTDAVRSLSNAISRPSVLVVDEGLAAAQALATSLRLMGVAARPVCGGAAALAEVKHSRIDVCIIELALSGMDGLALAEEIHAVDRRINCIVVSGPDASDLSKRRLPRVYSFARRPVDPVHLVRLVARSRG